MNLESQCVSLELAIKLKELNVPQKSLFYWVFEENKIHPMEPWLHYGKIQALQEWQYSAFTASELLEILPKFIGEYFIIVLPDLRQCWSIRYVDWEHTPMNVYPYIYCTDKNLCNALAKILIFLIENKIIEVPE